MVISQDEYCTINDRKCMINCGRICSIELLTSVQEKIIRPPLEKLGDAKFPTLLQLL